MFCKTYEDGTPPGTATLVGLRQVGIGVGGVNYADNTFDFPVPMRAAPSVTIWDGNGNVGKSSWRSSVALGAFTHNLTAIEAPANISAKNFRMRADSATQQVQHVHFAADADL